MLVSIFANIGNSSVTFFCNCSSPDVPGSPLYCAYFDIHSPVHTYINTRRMLIDAYCFSAPFIPVSLVSCIPNAVDFCVSPVTASTYANGSAVLCKTERKSEKKSDYKHVAQQHASPTASTISRMLSCRDPRICAGYCGFRYKSCLILARAVLKSRKDRQFASASVLFELYPFLRSNIRQKS